MKKAVSCDSTNLGGGGVALCNVQPPHATPGLHGGLRLERTQRTQRTQRAGLQGCNRGLHFGVVHFDVP